jgi:Gram-negative bacterial TonB protein C-terminal
MSHAQERMYRFSARIIVALGVLVLGVGANMSTAQQSKEPLPMVVVAGVPFYPPTARIAHIEGTVRLRITTDGKKASVITVESGPPMLVSAAEENVRTWQFRGHEAVTFETTFNYKMLPESECDLDSGVVMLRLPTQVEVSAKAWKTCDPAVEVKPSGR